MLELSAIGFRNSFRRVAETVIKIGRWRQIGRCETAAQGCDGLKSKASDDSCRTGVEYVRDNEGAGASMQRIEQFSYYSLARAYLSAS